MKKKLTKKILYWGLFVNIFLYNTYLCHHMEIMVSTA